MKMSYSTHSKLASLQQTAALNPISNSVVNGSCHQTYAESVNKIPC